MAKIGPLRIGINMTLPDLKKWDHTGLDPSELAKCDPSGLAKYDPSGLAKAGPLWIGTFQSWQNYEPFLPTLTRKDSL